MFKYYNTYKCYIHLIYISILVSGLSLSIQSLYFLGSNNFALKYKKTNKKTQKNPKRSMVKYI